MTTLRVNCTHRFPGGFQLAVAISADQGVTALFGPSGSGKTTLLNIVCGLLRPQQGNVFIAGQCLTDTERGVHAPPERRGVGYVPQDDLLFPHLSVNGNLRFGMGYAGGRGPGFQRVVKMLRLEELLDRDPATLSGGQKQRVALGRAVLRGPRVLLMDEPVSAQDEALKHRLVPDLRRLVDELQLTALVVCHDQNDIRRFADHVVLLEAGRVVGAGPADITLDGVFRARGTELFTPTNLVRVTRVHEESGQWMGALGSNVAALPAPSDPYADTVYASFAPTDVTLSRQDVLGVSIRNHWVGRVIDRAPVGGRVFVRIDVGQPIWAEITSQAQATLGLQVGETIICLVKTTALRALPQALGSDHSTERAANMPRA